MSGAAPGDSAVRWLVSADEAAALLRQGERLPPWGEPRVRPLHGRVGEIAARRLGSGLDYAETGQFQPGDDPRHVHWRATARSGRLQVRRFHQDSQPEACCMVDRGPGMRFGTRGRLKVAQAARLALLLAANEVRRGAALSLLTLDPDLHWQPPGLGKAALQRLVNSLCGPAAPLPAETADHWPAVAARLAERLPIGARLYLVSDFHGLAESHRRLLAGLGRRFDTRALVVCDALERTLPAVGPLALTWGGRVATVDGRDPAARSRHAAAWAGRLELLEQVLGRAGIDWRLVPAEADDLPLLLRGEGAGV